MTAESARAAREIADAIRDNREVKTAYDAINNELWCIITEAGLQRIEAALLSFAANEAEECAKVAEDRSVIGYVPDIGCLTCFDRIARAIRARHSPPASTEPGK